MKKESAQAVLLQETHLTSFSEISDKEGRYIMVTGKMDDTAITLGSIYTPPGSDFALYRKLFDLMMGATGTVILGGDWNIRLNPKLDTSKTVTSLHKKINILMSELGILDLWRDFYPSSRDYTFYSCPHDVYSRIDYFLC